MPKRVAGFCRGASAVTLALVTLGAAESSFAAKPASPTVTAPAVQAVLACRALTDDAQRLACFDKATAAMGQAESSGDLVTLDRDQRRAVRKQAFGFTMPALDLFNKGEKPEEVNRITGTVASASQDAYGKWTIRLDDGAVWRQIDDNEPLRAPHKGSTVLIKKGSLGSYFIDVDGGPGFRAHRDG
jgi:hypothetical protein